jgi:hydrogenase maturation protease
MPRRVVLGLGDVGHGDDGLGVLALKALGGRLGPQTGLELIDGGGLSAQRLLLLVEECSHLLVLDALNMDKKPGALIDLGPGEIARYSGLQVSAHQLAFQEALELAGPRGHLPPNLQILGIQPADLSAGREMSDVVCEALPELLERAVTLLRTWGLTTSPALTAEPS